MNYLPPTLSPQNILLFKKFEKFILEDYYPCVMAKTVIQSQQFDFHVYEKMGEISTAQSIIIDLDKYLEKVNLEENQFYSFIATFPKSTFENETSFEQVFWHQLQQLHDLDTVTWDSNVSSDPSNPNFSFSIRGQAFYLIGMHPNSSRIARQAPCPAIIFNLHSQFEQLRHMGVYQNIRNKIRKRDRVLQGSTNPMLENFGIASEVKQYSGRATNKEWKCPFHPNTAQKNNYDSND